MRDRRAKFVELAEKRVRRAIKDLRLVGNLANRQYYEYNDRDVRAMFKALEDELRQSRTKFESAGGSDGINFSLPPRGE